MTIQQRISIFKWSVALIAIVILFLVWKGCRGEGSGSKTTDTVSVRIDTIYVESKSDTFYTPKETKTVYLQEYKTDTLEITEAQMVDTANILLDYLATRFYRDSITVQYGKVYISDTITQNKIKSRGVKTDFDIPVIKETITLTQPKKTIAYLSFGAMASTESFLQQTSMGFGIKNKKDKYFGIEAAVSREGYLLYGGKIMLPIKLRKN